MARDLSFACRCGQITGSLAGVSGSDGTHIACHCHSCRATQIYLGQPDPGPGGIALFQTTPDRVTFHSGQDQLAVLSLRPGSLLRWYAACCRTPLFNTLPRPGFPLATLIAARLTDPDVLGKIRARSFTPDKNGRQTHKNAGRMVFGVMTRAAAARLSGRWKDTPFFDIATKSPVATPHILTKAERAALPLGG